MSGNEEELEPESNDGDGDTGPDNSSCVDAIHPRISAIFGKPESGAIVTKGKPSQENLDDKSQHRKLSFSTYDYPHNRYNPLTGEWVLVSPQRCKRPWKGQSEEKSKLPVEISDPGNPLCPGVTRPSGQQNPLYISTFTFDNDFPAMTESVPFSPEPSEEDEDPLFQAHSVTGHCRVMCFSPDSTKTVPTMSVSEIFRIINCWRKETIELGRKYTWVQIFENKGQVMGCSNSHPHCQIWASSFLPNAPRIKDQYQKNYFIKYRRPLLLDYVERELVKKDRIVLSNADWVVVVPYWAVWPYETLVLPKRHIQRFSDITESEELSLASIIKSLTTKYDNLFETSFPYSMGWHGAPTGKYLNENMEHWVFHGIYYPPLLRSASIKKFMTGFEMLAQAQRDLSPEFAASKLRSLSEVHYSEV